MRPLLAGLLVASALALSACYTSDKLLLDASQAATPLAVGHQMTAGGDDKPQAIDLKLTPDRWYTAPDSGERKIQGFLFVPLPGGGAGEQRYAYAIGTEEAGAPKGPFIYGVATRRQSAVYFDQPYCDQQPALAAAAAHGVAPAPPAPGRAISPVCTFTDAASLLGALRDYADTAPKRDLMHLPAAG